MEGIEVPVSLKNHKKCTYLPEDKATLPNASGTTLPSCVQIM